MNKEKRDELRKFINRFRPIPPDGLVTLQLLDYIDALEAALEFYSDRRNYPLAINNLYNFKAVVDMGAKAREALDKGK